MVFSLFNHRGLLLSEKGDKTVSPSEKHIQYQLEHFYIPFPKYILQYNHSFSVQSFSSVQPFIFRPTLRLSSDPSSSVQYFQHYTLGSKPI